MDADRTDGAESSMAYRWAIVGMLWFVCFFNYADRQAIFSVFPLLRGELHLSAVQLGIIGSSFMWVYALAGPVAGWLCDRFSRKRLVLGGLIFWSIATAATALAHSYKQLVLCRALGGLGEAFYFPASMSLIGDYHSSRTRSKAMAIHQSSVYVGSIAGGTASGYIGQMYGWRDTFLLFGGLGVLLGLLLSVVLREPKRGAAEAVEVLKSGQEALPTRVAHVYRSGLFRRVMELLASGTVITLITVFIGANFVAVVFLTWLPTFLFEKFHMSLARAGLNATVYLQMASVLGVLCGGVLADAIASRTKRFKTSGRMLTQSLGLLCGVPFLFIAGRTLVASILLTMLVGFGFFKGLYDANIWASLYDVVPVQRRGTAVGLMNSLGWLGGGTAPVAVAAFAQHSSIGAAISATALIYLLCASALLMQVFRISPATRSA